jgi:5-methylcytosine-specific restriction protein A
MNHPFVTGRNYPRASLLAFLGSKQGQSGILWGDCQPGAVICTSGGRHGSKAGYEDRQNSDGSWAYFGQGRSGSQDPARKANRLLVERQRSILLFRTKESTADQVRKQNSGKKNYEYRGEFCCAGWEHFVPTSGPRKGDALLLFTLVPVVDFPTPNADCQTAADGASGNTQQELRVQLAALAAGAVTTGQALHTYFVRSSMLKQYANKRADGKCEYCQLEAPFSTTAGEPYLEVHHILRLADDGPDAPENVACLCPNCHRRAHHGADRVHMQTELAMLLKKKEQSEPTSIGPRLNMTDAYSR